MEIGLEFIVAQQSAMQTSTDASQFDFLPPTLIWRHMQREVQKIIQNLHTELVSLGVQPPEPVLRHTVPDHVRCMEHSVFKDIRDFYIMKSLLKVSEFYHNYFSNVLLD